MLCLRTAFWGLFLSIFLKPPVPIECNVQLSGELVSLLFFSLAEAVGWQRLFWWWQLNDLFFIKHPLLSLSLPDYLASSLPSVFPFILWLIAHPLFLPLPSLSPLFSLFPRSRLATFRTVSPPVSLSICFFCLYLSFLWNIRDNILLFFTCGHQPASLSVCQSAG